MRNPRHGPRTGLECVEVRKVYPEHFAEFPLCLSHRAGFGGRRHRVQTSCYRVREVKGIEPEGSKRTWRNLLRKVHRLDEGRPAARRLGNGEILRVLDRRDGWDIL